MQLSSQDPSLQLPDDLRAQDPFGARDCGWVEQMRPFIREFSAPGECVLDPFCGFGTTLVAAECEGRRGVGWEVEPSRVRIATERLARLHCRGQTVLHPDQSNSSERADLILTSVPYFASVWTGSATSQLYSSESYAAYLEELRQHLVRWKLMLRPGGYLVVMAENIRVGAHFVPLAWDLAQQIRDRFVMEDERVLLYARDADEQGAPVITNRAHEYALIARNGRRPIDIAATIRWLKQLRCDCPDFVVFGSFASWLRLPSSGVAPSDADLLVPNDPGSVSAMARWLEAHGFRITRWGAPAAAHVMDSAMSAAYYFRAERLTSDGSLILFDVYFGENSERFEQAQLRAVMVDGLPIAHDKALVAGGPQ